MYKVGDSVLLIPLWSLWKQNTQAAISKVLSEMHAAARLPAHTHILAVICCLLSNLRSHEFDEVVVNVCLLWGLSVETG